MNDLKQPKYNFPLLLSSSTSVHSDTTTTSSTFSGTTPLSAASSKVGPSDGVFTPGTASLNGSSFITPGSVARSSCGTRSSVSFTGPRSAGSRSATPGSELRSNRIDQSSVIISIVEGRGLAKGEIGMASINLKQPVLMLSQFPDSQSYVKVMTKLMVVRPVEILMPNTVCDSGTKTKLYQLIHDQFSESTLTTVQRKYFNETKGLEYIKQLCAAEFNSVELDVAAKYYALAATSALLKYVEFIQNIVYAPNSLRVIFKGSEQTAMIDVTTVKNLELLSNARDPASGHSLFGLLNYTKTPCGARLLRSNILEPPTSVETIRLRQDCVQELTDHEEMFFSVESVLKRFLDVDHLISLCVQIPKRDTQKTAESTIAYVIYLKHTLELVSPLRQALEGAQCTLLKAFHQVLDDPRFEIIMTKISSCVHDDTHYQKGALNMRTQKCFCIKSGLSGMLDVTRRLYTEVIDDISALTEQICSKYNLQVRSIYNTTRGFYLQLYVGGNGSKKSSSSSVEGGEGLSVEQLPREFVKVSKQRNYINFTTADLIRLNSRANDSLSEIYRMTHTVLKELLTDIRQHIGCLYRLTECVAMLDMLHSFAHTCTVSSYVRPELTDTLAIKQGRHPILDKMSYDPPVPNNTYASAGSNFVIVTGPNMSGKSTHLRQVALLQIMAQMGCSIPADYACFRVANQVFSRIGSDDDIETNASTFMIEMREIHYILQNCDSTSLIIIDELGRGTSCEEGVGLCCAICEHLIATQAFTFFATHFLELTNMESLYHNVENYHFQIKYCSEGEHQTIKHTHVLAKGRTEERHYGLCLAEVSSIPQTVLQEAKEVAKKLKQVSTCSQQDTEVSQRSKAVHALGNRLAQVARNSLLDQESLKSYLSHLRADYLKEISRSNIS